MAGFQSCQARRQLFLRTPASTPRTSQNAPTHTHPIPRHAHRRSIARHAHRHSDWPRVTTSSPPGTALQVCTNATTVRAAFDGFALPPTVGAGMLWLEMDGPCNTNTSRPQLAQIGSAVGVFADCAESEVLLVPLAGAGVATATYSLPGTTDAAAALTLGVVWTAQGALQLCVGGQAVSPSQAVAAQGWVGAGAWQASGITLGPTDDDAAGALTGTIAAAYFASVENGTLTCQGLSSALVGTAAAATAASTAVPAAPALSLSPAADVFVNDTLTITASSITMSRWVWVFLGGGDIPCTAIAVAHLRQRAWTLPRRPSAPSPLPLRRETRPLLRCHTSLPPSLPSSRCCRLSVTFFGLVPPSCNATECGDLQASATGDDSQGSSLTTSVRYPYPGRYVIRARASDGRGHTAVTDTAVLVRRVGDTARRAACCRHTSLVVGGAAGRPIHRTAYHSNSTLRHAAMLGWSDAYVASTDLEAERLFDYGMLAPDAGTEAALTRTSCMATRLAGPGSPRLVTDLALDSAASVRGHGKLLALAPQGYSWATKADVECQSHWSGWERKYPYPTEAASPAGCSLGCTAAGTEMLIQETGAWSGRLWRAGAKRG